MEKKLLLCIMLFGYLSCSQDPNAFTRKDKKNAKIDIERVTVGDAGIVGHHIKSLENHLAKKNIPQKWEELMQDAIVFANQREDYQSYIKLQKRMDERINSINREQERRRVVREIAQDFRFFKKDTDLSKSAEAWEEGFVIGKIPEGTKATILKVVDYGLDIKRVQVKGRQWKRVYWLGSSMGFIDRGTKKQQDVIDDYNKVKSQANYNRAVESFLRA